MPREKDGSGALDSLVSVFSSWRSSIANHLRRDFYEKDKLLYWVQDNEAGKKLLRACIYIVAVQALLTY